MVQGALLCPDSAGLVLAAWYAAIFRHVVEPSSTCAERRLAGPATTVAQTGFMIIYEDCPQAPSAAERRGKSAKRAQSPLTVRACAKTILDRHQRQMPAVGPVVVAARDHNHDAA